MNTVVDKTFRVTAPVAVVIFVACVLSGCRSSSSEPAPAVEDRAMDELPAPAADEAPAVDMGDEGQEGPGDDQPPPPSAEEEEADEDPSDQY